MLIITFQITILYYKVNDTRTKTTLEIVTLI